MTNISHTCCSWKGISKDGEYGRLLCRRCSEKKGIFNFLVGILSMKLSATVQICIWEHSEEPVQVLIFIENCRISGILRVFFAFQSVLYNSFFIISKFS